MHSSLSNSINRVKVGRKWLYSQNEVKSGQMVGPEGTMAEINVAEIKKASIDYLSKIHKVIMDGFKDNGDLHSLLGDDEYTKRLYVLNNMLKGCGK